MVLKWLESVFASAGRLFAGGGFGLLSAGVTRNTPAPRSFGCHGAFFAEKRHRGSFHPLRVAGSTDA